MYTEHISRRVLLKRVAVLGMLIAVERLVPSYAVTNTIVNPTFRLLGRAGYCPARPSLGCRAPLLGDDLKEFDLEY